LKAVVAFCVLQSWEIRRLAKAAAIHDTDGANPLFQYQLQFAFLRASEFSCQEFELQVP
jgi:hypothetical protein